MKRTPLFTLLLLLTIAVLASACGSRHEGQPGSDAARLEALDIQIQRHPQKASLLAERGSLLVRLGRAKEGQYDLERAVKLKPENVDYMMWLADAYLANGNTDQCFHTLAQAEELEPARTDVHLKMGEIAYIKKNYDRSLKSLSQVTEADPDNRTALYMKASIYKAKGDTTSAVSLFRKVCDLYPDYAPAFEELGIIYSPRNYPLATDYLNTALRLDSTNTNTMYALALCHQEAGHIDEAESLYHRLLTINPNSADAWHNLGYIELFHYKDYAKAIGYMTKAIEADSQCIEALVNRGCAYELSGRTADARRDFEAALAIDSDYPPALDGLHRVD